MDNGICEKINNPKVALCISGLARGAIFCFDKIYEKIIAPLNADVFIHTWNLDIDIKNNQNRFLNVKSVWSSQKEKEEYFYLQSKNKKFELSYLCENYNSNEWNFLETNINENNVVPMSYSIYRSNQLKIEKEKKEGFLYDIVIRSRFDSLYGQSIPENEINNVLSTNKIYVGSAICDSGIRLPRRNFLFEKTLDKQIPFIADGFAFGNSTSMNFYSDLYLDIPQIKKFWNNCLVSEICPPECFLGISLKNKKIVVEWSEIRFKYLKEIFQNCATFESIYGLPEIERIKI